MPEIVKKKAGSLDNPFYDKDIRYDYIGNFDAIIALFNSLGHLTVKDFEMGAKCLQKFKRKRIFYF